MHNKSEHLVFFFQMQLHLNNLNKMLTTTIHIQTVAFTIIFMVHECIFKNPNKICYSVL